MNYKAMYKSELARAAGVSLKVLNRWLEPHRQQLAAFGVGKYDKMLPPSAVHYTSTTTSFPSTPPTAGTVSSRFP